MNDMAKYEIKKYTTAEYVVAEVIENGVTEIKARCSTEEFAERIVSLAAENKKLRKLSSDVLYRVKTIKSSKVLRGNIKKRTAWLETVIEMIEQALKEGE